MTELNMYPTWSFVRINATYTNRIPSGGVSYAPFCHFVLLKKYIVYGQGPIVCLYAAFLFWPSITIIDKLNQDFYWLLPEQKQIQIYLLNQMKISIRVEQVVGWMPRSPYTHFYIQENLCKTATLKGPKIGFQHQLSFNAGQKYCRMLLQYF